MRIPGVVGLIGAVCTLRAGRGRVLPTFWFGRAGRVRRTIARLVGEVVQRAPSARTHGAIVRAVESGYLRTTDGWRRWSFVAWHVQI